MSSARDFRRIALQMADAIESAHMGHPDFRVGGRIFATLHTGDKTGMVVVTPQEQQTLQRDHPEVFAPEAGAWGRQGCTRVTLARADGEILGEAITLAWQNAVAKNAAKKTPRKSAKKPKPRP
jgi:hypothetical protein